MYRTRLSVWLKLCEQRSPWNSFLTHSTSMRQTLSMDCQRSFNIVRTSKNECMSRVTLFVTFSKAPSFRWCFASSICQSRWWQNPQDRPTSTAGIRKINRSLYQKYDKRKQINFDVKLNLGLIVISFSAQNLQRFSTSSLLSLSWPGTNFSQ